MAHRQQLKLPVDSRRTKGPRFVFCREDEPRNTRKRQRDVDVEDAGGTSDEEPDFYGFSADSFIFGEEPPIETQLHNGNHKQSNQIRKSKRNAKKKRKGDFIYF